MTPAAGDILFDGRSAMFWCGGVWRSVRPCLEGHPCLEELLPSECLPILEENSERVVRSDDDYARLVADSPLVRPCKDPLLKRNRKLYFGFVRRFLRIGCWRYALSPLDFVGPFFVKQSKGMIRFIADARLPNLRFLEPPSVARCAPEGLSRVDVELLEHINVDDEALRELLQPFSVWFDDGDVADCLHRMIQPLWMSRHFCAEPVPARVVGMADQTLQPWALIWPCAAPLRMGSTWASYFAHRANENVILRSPGFADSLLVADRGQLPVFVPAREAEDESRHFVYIGSLGLFKTSESGAKCAMSEVSAIFAGHGLPLHGVDISQDAEALGCRRDGRQL